MSQPLAIIGAATALILSFTPARAQEGADARVACQGEVVPYGSRPPAMERWRLHLPETAGGGALLYVGAVHSRDPGHSQVADIVTRWESFGPTVAFYEGPDRGYAETVAETVEAGGESALVRHLAARDGVELARLEPAAPDEADFLLKRFPADQVKLFYVLREATRLREAEGLGPAEVEERIATLLERAKSLGRIGRTITTIGELEAAYRSYWSSPADWRQAPSRWFDPLRSSEETGGIFTNEVNAASSHYRDVHMFQVLAEAALAGGRVFAVVGRNHVPMQEPALRCALRPSS